MAKDATIKAGTAADSEDVTGNYLITYVDGTVTINKKQLERPTLTGTYTYDGTMQTATLSAAFDSSTMTVNNNTRTDAGTQIIKVSIDDKDNYEWADGEITDHEIEWTIAQRKVTVTATPQTITYGETIAISVDNATLTGQVDGHVLAAVTLETEATNAGTGAIIPSAATIKSSADADAEDVTANYDITYVDGTVTIEQKEIAVTWPENNKLIYTGSAQAPIAGTDNVIDGVNGEKIELTISGAETEEGGPYTATATIANVIGGQVGNYVLTNETFEFYIEANADISKAIVTITPNSYEYTGSPIIPAMITVELEGNTLKEGRDYEVEYINNTEVGIAIARITGINAFRGTIDGTYNIEKAEREISVIMNSYQHGGEMTHPTLSNSVELGDVEYFYNTIDSNVNGNVWEDSFTSDKLAVGTYYMYATISESAHYKATTTATTMFKVFGLTATQPIVENKVYNGSIQVGVHSAIGIEITGDYQAINAGTYTAQGTLMPNYEWPANSSQNEYTWKIDPADINDTIISINPTIYSYTGEAQKPTVSITYNGMTLTQGQDFTVGYKNNINIGTAQVIITGIKNFSGSCTKEFKIEEVLLGRIEIENDSLIYTGDAIEPLEKVYDINGNLLTKDKDYTVYYRNNIEIGTAVIGAIGIGNYAGSVETTFEIAGISIENAQITLSGFPYIYDGTAKRPEATVTLNGKTLVNGRDYEVVYENNINAGENTAIARINGKGAYVGITEKTFTIMKADRKAFILPGKALLLGETAGLRFNYTGEVGNTTLTIGDTSIASAAVKTYTANDTIDLTGLKVGKSTLRLVVAATNNYNELVLNSEVTVFEKIEDTYPIYGMVLINDNEEYTVTPKVMLTLNVDYGDYMYISESNVTPSIDDSEWYEYSTKMPYEFGADEGVKTIYVWFKDKKGNMSNVATDSIILDYDADIPAHDSVMVDQTPINQAAPGAEVNEYYNNGVDIKVIFNQEDVMVNGVRSGVDHSTIKYGYKEYDGIVGSGYIWQDSPIITGLKYNTSYVFVTQAYDRAGNGVTISDETNYQTERKYDITITLKDTNAQYTGLIKNIDEAEITLVNDTQITGALTYTYYVDEACTILTTPARDGSNIEGGAPSNPGIYYVKAELTNDIAYYDAVSNVAELRIGWDISKADADNVFAYVERVNQDSDEYVLTIIGEGQMTDLDDLLGDSGADSKVYWTDYQDKIIDIEFRNTETESVTNIGAEMFKDLTNITDIEIPDTIKQIGDHAFEGCTGVNQVIEIPVSVVEIGNGAFVDVNTPAFEVATGNQYFDDIDGVLTDIEQKELIAYPNGKIDANGEPVEKYNIPDTIKTIKENAFTGADNLKNVVIPNGVKDIETNAFADVPNLKVVEIEDLMLPDTKPDLNSVGMGAFEGIASDSIIYTFSGDIAKEFVSGDNYVAGDTDIYYPPTITLQPKDMNGAIGYTVKFTVDTEAGNPKTTEYQWFKVKDGEEKPIDGATSKEYTTDVLTADDDNTEYYVRVWNDKYYYDRGYLNSNKAKLTILDNANYEVIRGEYNYLFETLQDAFDFAITDDVIKVLKDVSNEADATLTGNESITMNLNNHSVAMDGTVEIAIGSKLELAGNGSFTKAGAGSATSGSDDDKYIFANKGDLVISETVNKGDLVINGIVNITNTTGYAIKSFEDSTLTITAGNITTQSNAIYAENAIVNINGKNVNITASTASATGNAISLHGNTKFNMTAGNVSIEYTGTATNANINGIYNAGNASGEVNISDGTVTAESATTGAGAVDAISNAGASDVIISGIAEISGSRSGITTTNTNTNGNIRLEGGTVSGGEFGILNNANGAKVILGKAGGGEPEETPKVVGEKVAIFNTKSNNTLEFYDGILYSHGANVIYESLNNTGLTIDSANTDYVYTEDGRADIVTESRYSITIKENVSTYTAAYLAQSIPPTLSTITNVEVEVGETGTFEITATSEQPDVYEYQWEISTDGGFTWSKVTNGTGGNTDRYTTPIANLTMDGYQYRCVVTNGNTSVTSNVARLIVKEIIDVGNLRPTARFVFPDGRVLVTEGTGDDEERFVNVQLVVKSFAELSILNLNGVNLLSLGEGTAYESTDGAMIIPNVTNTPIEIDREISGSSEIVEYTYTYNIRVYENTILTAKVVDSLGRDTTATQTIDIFYNLKVRCYITELSSTNKDVEVIFYANKPVKPTKSISNSYSNSVYLDLVSLDKKEYSYRYSLSLDEPLSTTVFWFEDSYKNQATATVDEILRVKYKEIKFSEGTLEIDDLTIVDAYRIAQNLENVTEVNSKEEIQSRYGLNSVQSDMFMSRARDIGAVDTLSGASTAKAYDGVFTEEIKATGVAEEPAHNFMASTGSLFIAAAARASDDNAFTDENPKYVDIISNDISLYKGMDISDFSIDDSAPYMYNTGSGVSNIDASTIVEAGFRATIIVK